MIPQRTFTAMHKPTAMCKFFNEELNLPELSQRLQAFVNSCLHEYDNVVAKNHVHLVSADLVLKLSSALVELNKTQAHHHWTNELLRKAQLSAMTSAIVSGSDMSTFGTAYAEVIAQTCNVAKSAELSYYCSVTGTFSEEQKTKLKALLGGERGIQAIREHLNFLLPPKAWMEANIKAIVQRSFLPPPSTASTASGSQTPSQDEEEKARARAKAKASHELE